jgi:ABC-type xylose transport system permease subunit
MTEARRDTSMQQRVRAVAARGSGRSLRLLGILLALALIWVYFGLSSEYFFTRTNIFNILLQAANIGIIAAGLTVVMITAEIDLSIGSLEALSGSVAAVVIIRYGMPIAVGIAAAIATTVLAGAVSS